MCWAFGVGGLAFGVVKYFNAKHLTPIALTPIAQRPKAGESGLVHEIDWHETLFLECQRHTRRTAQRRTSPFYCGGTAAHSLPAGDQSSAGRCRCGDAGLSRVLALSSEKGVLRYGAFQPDRAAERSHRVEYDIAGKI